jgi:hypothetical protein
MPSESTEPDAWHPVAELAWLALWIALLSWSLAQAPEVPSHLRHHVEEALVLGAIVLGLPISALVALALFALGFLVTTLHIASPEVSVRSALVGYWLIFLIPAVLQRAKRLPFSGRLWQKARSKTIPNP